MKNNNSGNNSGNMRGEGQGRKQGNLTGGQKRIAPMKALLPTLIPPITIDALPTYT